MKTAIAVATLVLFACASLLFAREAREQERIDFLIRSVETLKGGKFIRNGSEYDAAAAVKHLKAKLNYGGERIKTAEDFVKYCASESSITHRKYTIRLPDGASMDSEKFFAEKLHEIDSARTH